MKRLISAPLVGVLLSLFLVAGCGSRGSDTAAPSAPQACPTANTEHFAKTKFLVDVGLAAGTFHHFILKPYKAGAFKSGAPHRFTSFVKAGLAAAFVYNRLKAAKAQVYNSPFLCKHLGSRMTALYAGVGALLLKLKHRDDPSADIQADNTAVSGVESGSAQTGNPITEQVGSVPGA